VRKIFTLAVPIADNLYLGHETTSGLLSFAMLNLLKNESAYCAAQQEVDTVVGRGPVRIEHLKSWST
jgi:cytochrome P450/NADPH-cytochrome P450 reductase